MASRDESPLAPRTDVLISNAWGRTPYNVIRSLARQQLRVVVGTDRFGGMAALSRYPAATFRHAIATIQPAAFMKHVCNAIERYMPRVYLPMSEDTYIISRHLDEFRSSGVGIPVAPYPTIKMLHRKDEATTVARSLGIPVPDTVVPKSHDEIRDFCEKHGSRGVLKRISSSSARGVFYFSNGQLTAARSGNPLDTTPLSHFVLQEYVRGTGYGVSMLFNRGRLRAKFTHKRLEEMPPTGGTSILRTSVVHPVLEQYAQRLLESVNFHGVAMVEFKHNEETGESWLLEVNPRFWGSLALAMQSGIDFPFLLFRMATEGDIEPVTSYRTGVVVKWLLGDVTQQIRRFTRPNQNGVRERAKPEAYDDFHWDDPMAFLGGTALALWKHVATRSWRHDEFAVGMDLLDTLDRGTGDDVGPVRLRWDADHA